MGDPSQVKEHMKSVRDWMIQDLQYSEGDAEVSSVAAKFPKLLNLFALVSEDQLRQELGTESTVDPRALWSFICAQAKNIRYPLPGGTWACLGYVPSLLSSFLRPPDVATDSSLSSFCAPFRVVVAAACRLYPRGWCRSVNYGRGAVDRIRSSSSTLATRSSSTARGPTMAPKASSPPRIPELPKTSSDDDDKVGKKTTTTTTTTKKCSMESDDDLSDDDADDDSEEDTKKKKKKKKKLKMKTSPMRRKRKYDDSDFVSSDDDDAEEDRKKKKKVKKKTLMRRKRYMHDNYSDSDE